MKNLNELNKNRIKMFGYDGDESNGAFKFRIKGNDYLVIASNGGGWEHVSVSCISRVPSWEIMCEIKDMFFNEDEVVMQLHPAKKDYINNLDVTKLTDKPLYTEDVSLFDVIVYKRKNLRTKNAKISLYGDRIVIKENESSVLEFSFDEVGAVTILGKNKLNIYTDDNVYQITGSKRFNALKYVHIYNRYLNISSGNENEVFLGI